MRTLEACGLDGSTLWGFLAALGAARILDEHGTATLAFNSTGHALLALDTEGKETIDELIANELKGRAQQWLAVVGAALCPKGLTREHFAAEVESAGEDDQRPGDDQRPARDKLAFLAAVAAAGCEDVHESTLCASNGAGHQNWFRAMTDIVTLADAERIRKAICEPWTFRDEVPPDAGLGDRKPTLRFDPGDERVHALRLSDPTSKVEPYRSEWAGSALAMCALPLLPTVPTGRRAMTVSSLKTSSTEIAFQWVLWERPATLHTIRSLLAMGVRDAPALRQRGAFAAFAARRVSGEKGKLSFRPTQPLW